MLVQNKGYSKPMKQNQPISNKKILFCNYCYQPNLPKVFQFKKYSDSIMIERHRFETDMILMTFQLRKIKSLSTDFNLN